MIGLSQAELHSVQPKCATSVVATGPLFFVMVTVLPHTDGVGSLAAAAHLLYLQAAAPVAVCWGVGWRGAPPCARPQALLRMWGGGGVGVCVMIGCAGVCVASPCLKS